MKIIYKGTCLMFSLIPFYIYSSIQLCIINNYSNVVNIYLGHYLFIEIKTCDRSRLMVWIIQRCASNGSNNLRTWKKLQCWYEPPDHFLNSFDWSLPFFSLNFFLKESTDWNPFFFFFGMGWPKLDPVNPPSLNWHTISGSVEGKEILSTG